MHTTNAATITIGETAIAPTADSGNGGLLLAQQATLSQTATLQSFSFYVTTASGNLRLGIYDATGPGGGPGQKKAETNSFVPVVGWNTQNVITPVSLPSGIYWLAYLPSSSSLGFRVDNSSGTTRYYSFTFGVMPQTFSTTPTVCGCHWSFYGTLNTTPDTIPPSQPTNLSGTPISSSQINLSWSPSTDNVGVTGYKVFRGGVQVGTSAGTTYSDTGLSASTTYTYLVSAYDAAGNVSASSTPVSLTTQPFTGDTTPPTVSITAPLNGTTVTGTAVTVSGTASDNISVSGVQFLLDNTNLGIEDTTSPYSITWNTTTAGGGPHTLSARARDAAGNKATSTINVIVDNQAPTGTIVINGGAQATNSQNSTLTLSATDSSTVTQMRFSNTGSSYSTAETYATTKAWTLTTGAGTKTVYAQFKDAAGNWSGSFTDTIVLDTTAPTISAVASSGITNNSAIITWTTNELATSQVNYGLTTSYGATTTLDTTLVTAHSVTITGLNSQTLYNYRARSKDAAGNERVGNNATFTTLSGPDTTPPTVPGGLAAIVFSSTQINLSWNASTDNVGVTGYLLFRNGGLIASQLARTFNDTNLATSTNYTYTVAARDAAGNISAQSAPVNAATPAMVVSNVQTSNITSNRATVTWDTDQPATSAVELGPTSAYGSITAEDPALVTSHSVLVTGLTSNTTYHFRTHSADATDQHAYSPDGVFSTLPSGSGGTFQNEILVTNLDFPDTLEFQPDGSMLVGELTGTIKRILPGATQAEAVPFMQITNIGNEGGLQGLFDMELDPNYATNRFFYVFYTMNSPNLDRLSRFTADPSGTTASLGSEFVIYQDTVDSGTDHHGGAIVFGNDGKIYVTVGEHFTSISQDLTVPRGKVLRYNPDGSVPTDNPFYDGAGSNYDAIWAYGFRNPFRMTIDRPTGRIFVADVGGNDPPTAREEVNLLTRGANYSWPNCEGVCGTVDPGDPIYDYSHFAPGGGTRDASVTGGFVYRGTQFPVSYQGSYFFGDYTQNWIRRLTFNATGTAVTGMQFFEPADGSLDAPIGAVVCLAEGPDGALYYCDLGWENESTLTGGKIRRIRFISNNQPPVVFASSDITAGTSTPLTVNFSSAGTFDPEGDTITYNWDFGDGTSSTLPSPQHIYTTKGQYTVRLSASDGNLSTLGDPIVIRVGNLPQATIFSPNDGIFFRGGDVIAFSGDGSDLEDGTLPLSAFTWNIDFLHDGHIHPGPSYPATKSGTFTIPTSGHDFQGNTRYRIKLTVTDSDGLQTSASVIIWPDKVNLNFNTSPSGLSFTLDGITHTTPFVYDTLVGFVHTVEARNQSTATTTYTFQSWSDGGAQTHIITVPTSPQSYTATYNAAPNTTPIIMGETTVFSGDDSGNGGLLIGQDTTLTQAATIQSLSFYVNTASGNLRLGIYDATGPSGGPGALKAETNAFTPIVGWNTANVITPVSLPAGNYWLTYLPSSSSLHFATNFSIGSYRYATFIFGPMPATFPVIAGQGTTHWSLYGTLSP